MLNEDKEEYLHCITSDIYFSLQRLPEKLVQGYEGPAKRHLNIGTLSGKPEKHLFFTMCTDGIETSFLIMAPEFNIATTGVK